MGQKNVVHARFCFEGLFFASEIFYMQVLTVQRRARWHGTFLVQKTWNKRFEKVKASLFDRKFCFVCEG